MLLLKQTAIDTNIFTLLTFIDDADQNANHINIGQYISSNVPSLKGFREELKNQQNSIYSLKALASVMFMLQRYGWVMFTCLIILV